MQKAKLDVLFAFFAYGGNGGVAMQLPAITTWFARRYKEIGEDERIGQLAVKQYGDIPLTMERNRVVKDAQAGGFDVIVMIDSDNVPDLYLGHQPQAKPFWQTSFDFLYERKLRGLPTVVCAPYCGPPPHPVSGGEENVYVFYAVGEETPETEGGFGGLRFEAYSREHAAIMRGLQPCAAGPTGCIVYTTDAFDLMPIGPAPEKVLHDYAAGQISMERAKQLLRMESWFFYEFTDQYQTNKASTEDVTNTREIQLAGVEKFGEPVVFCNWDAWAGHYKPKCVGAPMQLRLEQVSGVFAEAVRKNVSVAEEMVEVDFTDQDLDQPVKRELRLSKPFDNPVMDDMDCQQVRQIVQSVFRATRVLVLGDETGEISYAVHWDPQCMTYAHGIGEDWGELEQLDDIRIVTDHQHISGKELAENLPPQELDGVVICKTDNFDETAGLWLDKHVKDGGFVITLDPQHDHAQGWMDSLDRYDCRYIEGSSVYLVTKRNDVVAAV